jgi:DNA (cytosine-5)-methyltransferase 1
VLSTFSGISSASVAFIRQGYEFVAYAEPAAFPAAVLHQRLGAGRPRYLPDGHDFRPALYKDIPVEGVPNFGDLTQITLKDLESLGEVDVLEGGSPCQAFSVAGLRGGFGDHRGNLTLAFMQLAMKMREVNNLKYIIWENVHGAVGHPDNPLGCLLGAGVGEQHPLQPPRSGWTNAGHVSGPEGEAAWRTCDSRFWGVPQRRRRVYAVFALGTGPVADPGKILFEQAGEGWGPDALAAAGQEAPRRAQAGSGELTAYLPFDSQYSHTMNPETAQCLVAHAGKSPPAIVHPFQQAGCISSQQGLGFGEDGDPMYTLIAGKNHGVVHPLLNGGRRGEGQALGFADEGDPMYTLTSTGQVHGVVHPEIAPTLLASACGTARMGGSGMGGGEAGFCIVHPNTVGTLMTTSGASKHIDIEHVPVIADRAGGYVVRRLMPVECERLMGFPDSWTDIVWKKKEAPDSLRYRALGNSMCTMNMAFIGASLLREHRRISAGV